jgi:hypothetical protein
MSEILLSAVVALLLMAVLAPPCHAQEQSAAPEPGLESFQPGSTRAQWYDCGCYDQPVKHFPYSVVVFEMPQADLVTRPERREGGLTFSPLAHRYGTRYCALDSEQDCLRIVSPSMRLHRFSLRSGSRGILSDLQVDGLRGRLRKRSPLSPRARKERRGFEQRSAQGLINGFFRTRRTAATRCGRRNGRTCVMYTPPTPFV